MMIAISPFSWPCPNPDCLTVLDQARVYVGEKLDGAFLPSYAELGESAVYQAIRQEIAQALAVGDLEATKVACRRWCKLVIGWTKDHASPVEPIVVLDNTIHEEVMV